MKKIWKSHGLFLQDAHSLCGGLKENAPAGSWLWILGPQLVGYLGDVMESWEGAALLKEAKTKLNPFSFKLALAPVFYHSDRKYLKDSVRKENEEARSGSARKAICQWSETAPKESLWVFFRHWISNPIVKHGSVERAESCPWKSNGWFSNFSDQKSQYQQT